LRPRLCAQQLYWTTALPSPPPLLPTTNIPQTHAQPRSRHPRPPLPPAAPRPKNKARHHALHHGDRSIGAGSGKGEGGAEWGVVGGVNTEEGRGKGCGGGRRAMRE